MRDQTVSTRDLRSRFRLPILLAATITACGVLAASAAAQTASFSDHGTSVMTQGITAHGQLLRPVNANKSQNWSGYNQGTIEQGGKVFTSISGRWTVPTVTQRTPGQAEYSSDWVGIGGGCVNPTCTITDSTLIQTGTEQDVSSNGQPSYSAWWELIPLPSFTIKNMAIHPGDQMAASINRVLPGYWQITIADLTTGQYFTHTFPYSSSQNTAEWIEETPLVIGTGGGFAPLPNLSSPGFDLAKTNGAPANLKPSEEINLVNSKSQVIAAPSAPDPDSDGFNVCTWATSCAAPTTS
jgi:Peptidase A4 family